MSTVLDDIITRLVAQHGPDAVAASLARYQPAPVVPSPHPARTTDPSSSHRAADRHASKDVGRFSVSSRQAALLRAFHVRPMTDREAVGWTRGVESRVDVADVGAVEGARRRCSDLRAAGYIIDSGETAADGAIVWRITPLGLAALHSLDATGWSKP